MQSSLIYKGDVKIKVVHKTYKSHNNGTFALFDIFARFLARQPITQDILPSYITVESEDDTILNITNIPVIANYKTTFNGPAAIYNAAIQDSNLNDVTDGIQYFLKLYNGSDSLLASTEIASEILKQVNEGRQALVEWALYITNPSITSTSTGDSE